ncbi:MAG: serine/threonine protein kinase, partial [Deltaproteobacteria bacterium]|nr:serine/threonine protein kinase [Nannocystaceae bacterium]
MTNADTTARRGVGSGARTVEVDALRRFRGDAVEGAVMRSNIRGQLFGDDAPPLPRIGPLVLRKQLGRGGMGVVFAAWDPRLRRELAIKLISVDRRPDAAGIRDEARAIAAIDHENVVRVFAAGRCRVPGEIHPRVYIAMERIHGLTLRRWVTQRAPSSAAIVDAYRQAAWGLGAAHRAGITHGDFKPDNAMIDAHGRVRTMDFGLAVHRQASTISDERHHTGEHDHREIVGTPGYMAPELMSGRPPDPRSDQWALCASLYEALVGTLPFGPLGPDVDETPTAPKSIDRHIAAVLRRGLGYAPASRFPSMDALATALTATPPRRRVKVALGVTAMCGALLVGWSEAPRPCGDQVVLGGAWGDRTRTDIRRALAESASEVTVARPEQLIETLDGYAAELAMELHATCESTAVSRVDDEPRSACLERCRRALQAVAQGLDQPDPEHVARARAAIARLPKIDDCADPNAQAFPLPRDPALARAVQRVRA